MSWLLYQCEKFIRFQTSRGLVLRVLEQAMKTINREVVVTFRYMDESDREMVRRYMNGEDDGDGCLSVNRPRKPRPSKAAAKALASMACEC